MKYPKIRGQKRRLKSLLNDIDNIKPSFHFADAYEHFHIPCGWWISEPKTNSKVHTEFCKKWLEKTQGIIDSKPKDNRFCKVVADITYPCFWNSQIIIFYDEDYYIDFFNRHGPYQTWTLIENKSFINERFIISDLNEKGYNEVINDVNETYKCEIWFYGEI